MDSADPYKVLNLDRDFTLDQLKKNYKRLALQLHPDKNVVKPEDAGRVFQLLTNCYKTLLREHEARQSDKPFFELRNAARTSEASPVLPPAPHDGKFDVDRFNKVFSENAIEDAYSKGYSTWIEKSAVNPMKAAAKEQRQEHAIIKHQHPQPFAVAVKSKMEFYELGVDAINDFSADRDGVVGKSGVTFMDYKRSWTTTKIVDPDKVKPKKEYKNIQELEAERANISYTLSAREAARQEKIEALKQKREHERVEALRQHDALIAQQFERVNRLMLGHRAS
jgi:DNA mismatch repair ATPase MutL